MRWKSEQAVVERTQRGPITIPSIVADLAALGVQPGMTLLVHSSLSAIGWVCGGPLAVVLALEEALGPQGTLVMPTQSGGLSDPEHWQAPPVPREWWAAIRETTPAYDPALTPTRWMGAIVECFRTQPGVLRSAHPLVSFAAWGAHAADIIEGHSFAYGLGEVSPLARIYERDGWVLLLGVGHGNNTSLHLAEHRANFPGKRQTEQHAPVLVAGRRTRITFPELDYDDSDFVTLGADFARETGLERRGLIGDATALLIPQKPLIDYAVEWMERRRVTR
jgi:aminoglycoside 3-N-acetyltransferase